MYKRETSTIKTLLLHVLALYKDMKKLYCCNNKAYEDYYLSQVGNGMPYYTGVQYQRGNGIGSIFASIGRAVLPLLKSGAKTVGKEVLKSGAQFASDVASGKNVKQAALRRAKETGSNLFQRIATPGRLDTPIKRKRKNNSRIKRASKRPKDIFD